MAEKERERGEGEEEGGTLGGSGKNIKDILAPTILIFVHGRPENYFFVNSLGLGSHFPLYPMKVLLLLRC